MTVAGNDSPRPHDHRPHCRRRAAARPGPALGARARLAELQLLATAVDGDDAIDRVLADAPDIVFLDIRMPGRNGLEATEAIVEDWRIAGGHCP